MSTTHLPLFGAYELGMGLGIVKLYILTAQLTLNLILTL
jgi:hypothetical protein